MYRISSSHSRKLLLCIWASLGLIFHLTACTDSPPKEPVTENPAATAMPEEQSNQAIARVTTGAERLLSGEMASLQGKKVGVVTNHTARVFGNVHLVDSLLGRGIDVVKVFAPEHGFRGTADAGEKVADGVDPETGLPILSLYGKNRKPSQEQIADLDVLIFDIQDVGTRFYTYISTMSYVMEACAEGGKAFMVLDRPNPNGNYVDGPMLEEAHSSFIGLHQVPIVHGMTVGEYATMVNGQGWLKGGLQADLKVVKMDIYRHDMTWDETGLEWIAPSPNLATEYSAYLYPAICWFEPTPVSVGRGTHDAFTMLGMPGFAANARQAPEELYGLELLPHTFTPVSLPGKSKYPKHENEACQGYTFQGRAASGRDLMLAGITLFQRFYEFAGGNEDFFKGNFERWPGSRNFREQIMEGLSAEAIYESWQEETNSFREMRAQYLLYP